MPQHPLVQMLHAHFLYSESATIARRGGLQSACGKPQLHGRGRLAVTLTRASPRLMHLAQLCQTLT